VVSVVVCLAILIAVILGIKGFSNKNEEDSTTEPTSSIETEATDEDFVTITLPDFRGMSIEEIKNDENYKKVLKIETVYEDSDQEKGTVIGQDLPQGTVVSSINQRSITLKVSDGLLVPDLVGEDATKALKILTDKGFKYVETVVSGVAHTQEQSNKVSGIVYYPEDTENWEALPDDRRISATLRVVIYCYGEYTPPAPVPTPEPTSPPTTEEPTTESDIVDDDIIVDGGEEDTEVEFIQ
jgi:beta-lactam-binding protein with PASTA domain